MNRKNIEEMIPKAMKVIKDSGIVTGENKNDSKYFGYLNGFGPAVITSGLLNTINYYSKEGKENQNDRKIICDILLNIIKKSGLLQFNENSLFDLTITKNSGATNDKLDFKKRVLEAVAACKLAIGTFSKMKDTGEKYDD